MKKYFKKQIEKKYLEQIKYSKEKTINYLLNRKDTIIQLIVD